MEVTAMMMFLTLNSTGNVSSVELDNNSSDDFNASVESQNNRTSLKLSFNEVALVLEAYVNPILIVFGTYGNAVSFYIMRRGSLRKVSTCFYMAMLAICDTLLLWTGCFSSFLFGATRYKVFTPAWLDCKLFFFLAPFLAQLSSCLLAVMCIEKFFALYFPLKMRSICTVAMAKKVTFVVTFLLAAYNIQAFFIFKADVIPNGDKRCFWANVSDYYAWIYLIIESTLYAYAPFTIMVLTNGAIIYKFMRASCARNQGGTESTNQALSKSANKGTAMLIIVSLAFLILMGPVSFVNLQIIQVDPVVQMVSILLRYTNNSINAVLYCISGSRFRNELMKTFPFKLCRKNNTNLRSGSQSVSSLTGNSTCATITSNVSVTASPN